MIAANSINTESHIAHNNIANMPAYYLYQYFVITPTHCMLQNTVLHVTDKNIIS